MKGKVHFKVVPNRTEHCFPVNSLSTAEHQNGGLRGSEQSNSGQKELVPFRGCAEQNSRTDTLFPHFDLLYGDANSPIDGKLCRSLSQTEHQNSHFFNSKWRVQSKAREEKMVRFKVISNRASVQPSFPLCFALKWTVQFEAREAGYSKNNSSIAKFSVHFNWSNWSLSRREK